MLFYLNYQNLHNLYFLMICFIVGYFGSKCATNIGVIVPAVSVQTVPLMG
jgi:hypothetical protein